VFDIKHLRTCGLPGQASTGNGVMGSREQVRAVIGRRLREHYEAAASQTIPDRLAKLLGEIEQSESRSERLRDERQDVPVDPSRIAATHGGDLSG
jgi:hypothetical protein